MYTYSIFFNFFNFVERFPRSDGDDYYKAFGLIVKHSLLTMLTIHPKGFFCCLRKV